MPRKFIGAFAPPKPIGEMTDEEIDQWANAIAPGIRQAILQSQTEADADDSQPERGEPDD